MEYSNSEPARDGNSIVAPFFDVRYQMKMYHLEPIPTLNARFEFNHYRKISISEEFWDQMENSKVDELDTGKFIWSGRNEGITVLVQRIVVGIESYIKVCALIELGVRGKLTKEKQDQIEDPFKLGGPHRTTADVYFNRIPKLVDERLQLRIFDQKLWSLTKDFYSKMRNRIFHGYSFKNIKRPEFEEIIHHFDDLYCWIDTWCPVIERMNTILKGSNK